MTFAPQIILTRRARHVVEHVRRAIRQFIEGGRDGSEFLPTAFAKEAERTLPAARAVVWLSGCFFLAALLWASLFSVDRTVTAEGKVRPAGHVQIMQSAERFKLGYQRGVHAHGHDVIGDIDELCVRYAQAPRERDPIEFKLLVFRRSPQCGNPRRADDDISG